MRSAPSLASVEGHPTWAGVPSLRFVRQLQCPHACHAPGRSRLNGATRCVDGSEHGNTTHSAGVLASPAIRAQCPPHSPLRLLRRLARPVAPASSGRMTPAELRWLMRWKRGSNAASDLRPSLMQQACAHMVAPWQENAFPPDRSLWPSRFWRSGSQPDVAGPRPSRALRRSSSRPRRSLRHRPHPLLHPWSRLPSRRRASSSSTTRS